MLQLYLMGMVLLGVLTPVPVQSTTTPTIAPAPHIIAQVETSDIKQRISYYADLYGVSEITMNIVVKCESNFNPEANGDGGNSHGLVQINAPSHPNITHAQMHDVDFSLDFLAKHLKMGHKFMWTCLKNN